MKKSNTMFTTIRRPVFYSFLFLLFIGCITQDDGGAYEGSYLGAVQYDGSYVGVWTGESDAEGNLLISMLVEGGLVSFTGTISGKGDFELQEVDGSRNGQGTIDRKDNISGSLNGDYELTGFARNDQSGYPGTWYMDDEGILNQLVLTRNTFSLNQDGDQDGIYETTDVESGTFTLNGNDVSVSPNGGTETGKYLLIDDKLVVAIVGLTTMVFTR